MSHLMDVWPGGHRYDSHCSMCDCNPELKAQTTEFIDLDGGFNGHSFCDQTTISDADAFLLMLRGQWDP